MRIAAWFLLALAATGCELNDVVVADAHDTVVAELYLRTGGALQQALLHRTRHGPDSVILAVPGARIEVRDAVGRVMSFEPTDITDCIDLERNDRPRNIDASCYESSAGTTYAIAPGARYTLRIELPGGGVMTGATAVPGEFELLRPRVPECSLSPETMLPIEWTTAANAWVYAAEARIAGLRPFLEPRGIDLHEDPLRLSGLSLSAADTTLIFPAELGVFQRFDDGVVEALALLQRGLPSGATAEVLIAAADRNYVNWERVGKFNPSGTVRIPSVRGQGTGVFGSLVLRRFRVEVDPSPHPRC